MYYMDTKPISVYDGIESCIYKLNEQLDISWFPIMKAIAAGEDQDVSNLAEKMKEKIKIF